MSQSLQVGFARVDISPRTASVPLAGFILTTFRLSGVIQDPLYAQCVALSDGEERCLYIMMDLTWVPADSVARFRKAIGDATGLREDRIFICAMHTHAAPDLESPLPNAVAYREEILPPILIEGAKRALADLKPAKLSCGKVQVGRPGAWLNFDRHYYCVPIEKKDNYTEEDLLPGEGELKSKYRKGDGYVAVKHKEDVDHNMQVLRFAREAADDVILVSFAVHPTFTGGPKNPTVSSDYPGALIRRLEELFPGSKCAYLNSCAGNVVSGTALPEEGIWGLTYEQKPKGMKVKLRSHYAYGETLAAYAFQALTRNMQESESQTLAFRRRMFVGTIDHSKDALCDTARKALEVFHREGHTQEAFDWCNQFGIGNVYACEAILQRAALPETDEIELNAIRIGDCAITTLPFDTFSSIGEQIKADSPFPVTVVNAYSCGCQNYLPNKNAHPECYEATKMRYLPGTGELLADALTEMLNELK